jgi:hypothetical protein
MAEGYFSQLKRSNDGNHHQVSTTHLGRTSRSSIFLYFNCKASDTDRMHKLLGQVVGRRLLYKPMVAAVELLSRRRVACRNYHRRALASRRDDDLAG